jgi:UDP-2,3-diacylglucosamine pyrophosphatase LpxH
MYLKLVCLGDQHIPYLNRKAHGIIIKFLKDIKPDKIILLGDLIDFWEISHFDKDPSRNNELILIVLGLRELGRMGVYVN